MKRNVEFRIKNNEIRDKNAEIHQQREELLSQAEQMQAVINELEKVSLVAKRTSNSIAIFDKHGDIEWVNEAYISYRRMSLDNFVDRFGKNILAHNPEPEIRERVEFALDRFEHVEYEHQVAHDDGTTFYLQRSLTPFFDGDNEPKYFIAIDTDISKLKIVKDQVTRKNHEIIDSMLYAKRIQQAMLPSVTKIQKRYPECFVYFKPKDIISGDFYWFYRRGNMNFIAVADCTGHGIPGAMLSMLGISLLNKIVREKKVHSPAQILNDLRKSLIHSLNPSDSDDIMTDGMDIALIRIDSKKRVMTFAGAMHSVLLVRNGTMETLAGERMPIGIYKSMDTPFKEKTIDLIKNDSVYLFTDGIYDQFGGPDNNRLLSKKLKKFLLGNSLLPMKEQYVELDKFHSKWMGNCQQVDDILVIGVKMQ